MSAQRRRQAACVVLAVIAAGVVAGCVSVRDESDRSATPPPATARVTFSSQPGNAEVYVDGKFRGTTYVVLTLSAGEHEIEMRLVGRATWTRTLTVVAGDDTTVTATLQPAGGE